MEGVLSGFCAAPAQLSPASPLRPAWAVHTLSRAPSLKRPTVGFRVLPAPRGSRPFGTLTASRLKYGNFAHFRFTSTILCDRCQNREDGTVVCL